MIVHPKTIAIIPRESDEYMIVSPDQWAHLEQLFQANDIGYVMKIADKRSMFSDDGIAFVYKVNLSPSKLFEVMDPSSGYRQCRVQAHN